MRTLAPLLLGLVLVAAASATGCNKEKKADPAPVSPPNPAQVNPGQDVQAQVLGPLKVDPTPKGKETLPGRAVERPMRLNELKQIGLFYRNYEVERNRPPAKAEDFLAYMQRDAPDIAEAIKVGHYQIVPNVRPSSEKVIAYEQQPDRAGNHYVTKGDTSVVPMTTPELLAALKAQGTLR